MTFPHDLLAGTAAERLARTLVHFGWQGALIAAALAVALRAAGRGSAGARYALCCAALGLMAAAPPATFWLLPNGPAPLAATARVPGELTKAEAPPLRELRGADPAPMGLAAPGRDASRPSAPVTRWVVALWASGVAVLAARLAVDALRVGLLRRRPAPLWPDRRELIEAVARRVGLRRAPRVVQSACLEVPTVVGWVKPLVVVPAGLLAGLSPFEVEAILAHEFAHVRRRDYLVNLLQSLVEVLLFYHPAVWWVSGLIRAERENCCDDVAAAACGDRLRYARVLARMEGLRTEPARLAIAAGGGSLLSRVRRLLEGTDSPGRRGCRPLAACAAVALGSVALASTDRSGVDEPAAAPDHHRAAQPVTATPTQAPAALPVPGAGGSEGKAVRPADENADEIPAPARPSPLPPPFDRLTSVTESQRAAIETLRRLQEPPAGQRDGRHAFMASLSQEQRLQLQEARKRTPPARGRLTADDLPFLSDGQKQVFLDLYRRQLDHEERVRQARREVLAALTPEQRRQMQAMRPALRAAERPAAGAAGGRAPVVSRGVLERADGRGVVVRAHFPGAATQTLNLEAGTETVVVRDGKACGLNELGAGDRVRVASAAGVATRIDARSAARAARTAPGAGPRTRAAAKSAGFVSPGGK